MTLNIAIDKTMDITKYGYYQKLYYKIDDIALYPSAIAVGMIMPYVISQDISLIKALYNSDQILIEAGNYLIVISQLPIFNDICSN